MLFYLIRPSFEDSTRCYGVNSREPPLVLQRVCCMIIKMNVPAKLRRTMLCALGVTLLVRNAPVTATEDSESNLGLPEITSRAAVTDRAVGRLGEKLFFDTRLSADGTISCSTCHKPEFAFSDRLPQAVGIGGKKGFRNTPTLLNVAFNTSQFWDGRKGTLESQATSPFLNQAEHALRSEESLLSLIRADEHYVSLFKSAFGPASDQITINYVSFALASFQRSLIAGGSPFDRYAYGNDATALSPSEQRGLALFKGVARCAECHTVGENEALFTDNSFHLSSVALARITPQLASITAHFEEALKGGSTIDELITSDQNVADLGRFVFSRNPADIAKFRTPTLRNIALTAPYMHDGSIATLEQVIEAELYTRSSEGEHMPIVTPQERADLAAFLRALTSARLPFPKKQ